MLHPARSKIGITSSRKLNGGVTAACVTVNKALTVWPPKLSVSSLAPSATGQKALPSRRTRAGLSGVIVASTVASRVMPSAWAAWTTTSWRSRVPER